MTLAAVVADAARRFGSRTAVAAGNGLRLDYLDLDLVSDAVAGGLQQRGIGTGDVVALLLPSSGEYLLAYLAAAKLGAITAGINPRLPAAQRSAMLEVASPALVVGTAELLDGVGVDAPVEEVTLATSAEDCLTGLRGDGPASTPPPDPDRVVAVVFTSGTTGTPKGAVFTERHLAAIDHLDTGDAPWGSGGPMLASTELVHVGAMTKLRWYLRLGATIHLLPRWRPGPALQVICDQRMTSIGAIAPQIALLLQLEDFDRYDVSAVTTIVAGGAPSPPDLVTQARERFAAAYSIRYSSTESGGVGTGTAFTAGDEEALHTVGRPRPRLELRLTADDGQVLPRGEIGTVELRSPAVMAGYWRDEAATSAVLVDGWLRTGDLGVIDDRGCLRLRGRRSDMYIRGGYNVHPEAVEAVLSRHPAVAEVAVVPAADTVMGEVGVAAVVLRPGAGEPDLSQLRDFAAAGLARHELPERLVVLPALPRTPLHKVDRAQPARAGRQLDSRRAATVACRSTSRPIV